MDEQKGKERKLGKMMKRRKEDKSRSRREEEETGFKIREDKS